MILEDIPKEKLSLMMVVHKDIQLKGAHSNIRTGAKQHNTPSHKVEGHSRVRGGHAKARGLDRRELPRICCRVSQGHGRADHFLPWGGGPPPLNTNVGYQCNQGKQMMQEVVNSLE